MQRVFRDGLRLLQFSYRRVVCAINIVYSESEGVRREIRISLHIENM